MGNILLLMAVCLSGCCVILSFVPVHLGRIRKILLVLWSLSTALVASAVVLLVTFQILSRFEYQYVYNHTSRDTALIYKISALWSGQEGSFLLWTLILGIIGFFVLWNNRRCENRTFGIYAAISFCIFLMCFISQPFEKTGIVSADGLGLNEALKDPWMVVHPPMVFISYSAMAVLFSLSATLSKSVSNDVSSRILAWLRFSWLSLGIGILTGSIWAYRALGWGGYWAWDPIENAALVPWLVLCGYLHRKEYNSRSVCMVPFPIACFGVFLARSGILKDRSAHAYADGNVIITGIIFCFILGVVLFLAFSKIRKMNNVKVENNFLKYDRRLIIYNINVYAALIFIGTVAPIFLNIEPPITYYTAISIAFALSYSILLLVWDWEWLKKRNILMIAVSTVLVIGIMVISGSVFWWLLFLWACLMPLSLWLVSGFRTKSWKYYLSHVGVVLLIAGAIGSSALGKEAFIMANPGSSNIVVAGMEIPLAELTEKAMLIKTLPTADIVIQCSKIIALSQGGALIPYVTKPLIMLFWIGCIAIIAHPCIVIISNRFTNSQK